jgi:hypothetical protein
MYCCFSTSIMVTRKPNNVTLYVHCLPYTLSYKLALLSILCFHETQLQAVVVQVRRRCYPSRFLDDTRKSHMEAAYLYPLRSFYRHRAKSTYPDIDWNIILIRIFKKWDGEVWTGSIWLRILVSTVMNLRAHKMRGIS